MKNINSPSRLSKKELQKLVLEQELSKLTPEERIIQEKLIKNNVTSKKNSNTSPSSKNKKPALADHITNKYNAVKSSSALAVGLYLLSWIGFLFNKLPFFKKLSIAIKIKRLLGTANAAPFLSLLILFRKAFIIINALLGIYLLSKITGWDQGSFIAGFIGMGHVYLDIFTGTIKSLFNWILSFLDMKVIPKVPTDKPNFPFNPWSGPGWYSQPMQDNGYVDIAEKAKNWYKSPVVETTPWYRDWSWTSLFYVMGGMSIAIGAYLTYTYFFGSSIENSNFSSPLVTPTDMKGKGPEIPVASSSTLDSANIAAAAASPINNNTGNRNIVGRTIGALNIYNRLPDLKGIYHKVVPQYMDSRTQNTWALDPQWSQTMYPNLPVDLSKPWYTRLRMNILGETVNERNIRMHLVSENVRLRHYYLVHNTYDGYDAYIDELSKKNLSKRIKTLSDFEPISSTPSTPSIPEIQLAGPSGTTPPSPGWGVPPKSPHVFAPRNSAITAGLELVNEFTSHKILSAPPSPTHLPSQSLDGFDEVPLEAPSNSNNTTPLGEASPSNSNAAPISELARPSATNSTPPPVTISEESSNMPLAGSWSGSNTVVASPSLLSPGLGPANNSGELIKLNLTPDSTYRKVQKELSKLCAAKAADTHIGAKADMTNYELEPIDIEGLKSLSSNDLLNMSIVKTSSYANGVNNKLAATAAAKAVSELDLNQKKVIFNFWAPINFMKYALNYCHGRKVEVMLSDKLENLFINLDSNKDITLEYIKHMLLMESKAGSARVISEYELCVLKRIHETVEDSIEMRSFITEERLIKLGKVLDSYDNYSDSSSSDEY